MNISAGIQTQMDKMGIKSLTSLARRTGINQPTLHKIMSSGTADPRISTLLALAKFFDVSVEELIQEKIK
jgi:transcriptional regulator with XRE-family HTH domain